jgi:hypothetical protein
MARRITWETSGAAPFSHGRLADWDQFADGSVWELTRGTDFHHASVGSASSSASEWAKRNGLRAITHSAGGTILRVQFVPEKPVDPKTYLLHGKSTPQMDGIHARQMERYEHYVKRQAAAKKGKR